MYTLMAIINIAIALTIGSLFSFDKIEVRRPFASTS